MAPRYWKLIDHDVVPCDDAAEWSRWFRSEQPSVEAEIDGLRVVTSFFGLELEPGTPPVLFETAIFDGPTIVHQVRSDTEDEAEACHAEAVRLVQSGTIVPAPMPPAESPLVISEEIKEIIKRKRMLAGLKPIDISNPDRIFHTPRGKRLYQEQTIEQTVTIPSYQRPLHAAYFRLKGHLDGVLRHHLMVGVRRYEMPATADEMKALAPLFGFDGSAVEAWAADEGEWFRSNIVQPPLKLRSGQDAAGAGTIASRLILP
jgi:hypothetical protein